MSLLLLCAAAAGQSRPVPGGARVILELGAVTNFVLGDVIEFTFVLTNSGPEVFEYQTGGDYRGTGFPTRFKFTVMDEQGAALPAETWMDMGGLSSNRPLKPGEEYRQQMRLQNYVRVSRPGIFSVSVVHDFGWEPTPARPLPVAKAIIKISLPTPDQAEKRVRAIVSKPGPEQDTGLGTYWTRTDFRYLSHPVFIDPLERCAAEGNEQAMEGIQRIESKEATLALVRLLDNSKTNVVHAAALFLCRRMPTRVVGGYPRRLGWYGSAEEPATFSALWVPEAAGPLRSAAGKLLESGVVNYVNTGAFVVENIGNEEDAPRVLRALGKTLAEWKVRSRPDDNILNAPGAGDALVNALAGLRERGYRTPRNGGVDVIMAQFLELADPSIPRAEGWQQTLEAFFTQNPPMLREAAVRALPKPPEGQWQKLLMVALNDADRGVMRTACSLAGESNDPAFVEPLANMVRTEPHEWVVREASEALKKLGAHWAATDAWIERLADEKMYSEGLRYLSEKLEHPKSNGSTGRTDLPREARIALRSKWQKFFADPQRQVLVRQNKPVPVSEAEARELFSGAFSYCVEGGKLWPPEGEQQ